MNKRQFFLVAILLVSSGVFSQENMNKEPKPCSFDVSQALEVESLFPMFLTGGFHVGVGYRYKKFRVRISVINGGDYDAEKAGINNSSAEFERHYKTSPGVFFGYNIWKNLEVYTYTEFHTFKIEQKNTGIKQDMRSTDFGGGVGYQFFVWKGLYVQPALHIYIRKDQYLNFGDTEYKIPNVDFSPVIRVGYCLWSN